MAPSASAYHWTQNPPNQGYHGPPPPGAQVDGDGGAQIIDRFGVAIATIDTGGATPWTAEQVAIQAGRMVFCVKYSNLAMCTDDTLDHVTARTDLTLSRLVNNQWVAVDTDSVVLIAYPDDQFFEQGWMYVWDIERAYQQGDLYCLTYEATCWWVEADMSIHMADNMIDMAYYELI